MAGETRWKKASVRNRGKKRRSKLRVRSKDKRFSADVTTIDRDEEYKFTHYKVTIKGRSEGFLQMCPLTLRCDSYRNCEFGCLYCFVSAIPSSQKYKLHPRNIGIGDILPLQKKLEKLFESDKEPTNPIDDLIKQGAPIQLGVLSDPFQPIEREKRVTLEVLKLLIRYNLTVLISTKGDLIAEEPYFSFKMDNKERIGVRISFCTFINKEKSKIIEPSAPSIEKRLKTLRKYKEAGLYAQARWHPVIPELVTKFEDIPEEVEALAGHADGLSSEFLMVSDLGQIVKENLRSTLGLDTKRYFAKYGAGKIGQHYDWKYSVVEKWGMKLLEECTRHDLDYYTGMTRLMHLSTIGEDKLTCCGPPCNPNFQKGLNVNSVRYQLGMYKGEEWHFSSQSPFGEDLAWKLIGDIVRDYQLTVADNVYVDEKKVSDFYLRKILNAESKFGGGYILEEKALYW